MVNRLHEHLPVHVVAAVNIFLLILLLLLRFCFDRALIIFIIYDLA